MLAGPPTNSQHFREDHQMSKHSKTMPKGEARPLGTKTPRVRSVKKTTKPEPLTAGSHEAEKTVFDPQNSLDSTEAPVVESAELPQTISSVAENNNHSVSGEKTMIFTIKNRSKNGKAVMYAGAAQLLRFPINAFVNKTAPESFELPDGIFAPTAVKVPKAKLTKE